MLRTQLLHPTILRALAGAGHGGKVLIADGNFSLSTHTYAQAERVYLNLRPGLVSVTEVLETILTAIPVEAAQVMQTTDGSEPGIYTDFRRQLPDLSLASVERFAFYELTRQPDVVLAVATGEQRLYANILLTIGVVQRQ